MEIYNEEVVVSELTGANKIRQSPHKLVLPFVSENQSAMRDHLYLFLFMIHFSTGKLRFGFMLFFYFFNLGGIGVRSVWNGCSSLKPKTLKTIKKQTKKHTKASFKKILNCIL